MGWTQRAVEIMIESYRAHPILYNTKDALYHNRVKKELAYQEVLEDVCKEKSDCTVDDVKKKMNGLRSNFAREMEKINKTKRSGAAAKDVHKPTVWWFQKLLFLKDHVEARPSSCSMSRGTDCNETLDKDSSANDDYGQELHDESPRPGTPSVGYSAKPCTSQEPSRPKPRAKKSRSVEESMLHTAADALTELKDAVVSSNMNESTSTPTQNEDQFDIFGKFVACEMRSLQHADIRQSAKRKINMALLDAQESELGRNTQLTRRVPPKHINNATVPPGKHGYNQQCSIMTYNGQPSRKDFPNVTTSNACSMGNTADILGNAMMQTFYSTE
ncbi:uncharacterized protein LOC135503313 [Lineus longissimus]|uniref:uncharacterized protein LOC135503313 n=1 Tax=Lineus longissimus TaxID=88925 RepID=UPI00315DE514